MRNSLTPAFVRLHYTGNAHQHTMTFSYRPVFSGGGGTLTALTRGGDTINLDDGISEYVDALKQVLSIADAFTAWEAYTQATATSVPVWIGAGSLIDGGGQATGAITPWEQLTMSFRTTAGGRFRVQLMELPLPNDHVWFGDGMSAASGLAGIVTYLKGFSCIPLARDDAYVAGAIGARTKTNDVLRRRYMG